MSEHDRKPGVPDILEQAIDAVRSQPMPAGPPADLLASTAKAIQNRLNSLRNSAKPRQRATRHIRYALFAAAAAAIVVWVFVGMNNGTARAFEKALEKLRSTQAVRYQVQTQSELSNQVDEVTIRGRQMRVELVALPKITWIVDSEISGMLILDPHGKTYQTVDLAAKSGAIAPFDIRGANMREQLEDLIKQKPIFVKAETIDGISTDRYSIGGVQSLGLVGDWTLWLDRESSCPVRIVFKSTQAGKTLTREYSKFDWNPKIAEGAFSFDPPATIEKTPSFARFAAGPLAQEKVILRHIRFVFRSAPCG